jgi:hypothetical protein
MNALMIFAAQMTPALCVIYAGLLALNDKPMGVWIWFLIVALFTGASAKTQTRGTNEDGK